MQTEDNKIRIYVRFYAVLKDYFGDHIQLDLRHDAVISEVIDILTAQNANGGPVLKNCRFAVNQEIAACAHVLKSGDIIDILPPSSGG